MILRLNRGIQRWRTPAARQLRRSSPWRDFVRAADEVSNCLSSLLLPEPHLELFTTISPVPSRVFSWKQRQVLSVTMFDDRLHQARLLGAMATTRKGLETDLSHATVGVLIGAGIVWRCFEPKFMPPYLLVARYQGDTIDLDEPFTRGTALVVDWLNTAGDWTHLTFPNESEWQSRSHALVQTSDYTDAAKEAAPRLNAFLDMCLSSTPVRSKQ